MRTRQLRGMWTTGISQLGATINYGSRNCLDRLVGLIYGRISPIERLGLRLGLGLGLTGRFSSGCTRIAMHLESRSDWRNAKMQRR